MELINSILSFSQEQLAKHKAIKRDNDNKLAQCLLKKEAMRLPFKISIYLELFQHILYDQISQDGYKQISQIDAFKTFSYEEKVLFLIQNIENASQIFEEIDRQKQFKKIINLQIQGAKLQNQKQGDILQLNIQTTAQMNVSLTTKMSIGYWVNVKFRLNVIRQQVIISGKQNCIIQIENYFVRKSKTNKNTLVLEAISFNLPSRFKKISLAFKSDIFQKVYQSLWDCMIKNQKKKLKLLFVQDNNKKVSEKNIYVGQGQQFQIKLQKGQFIFLTNYAIKSYFFQKQKIKKRLAKKFYDFKSIKTFTKQESKLIDKRLRKLTIQRSNKRPNFYQAVSEFTIPSEVLKFKFIDAFKKRNKFISQWQILQKTQNGLETLIQKYMIEDQQYNQLMIKQEGGNNEIISMECIGSLSQKVFVHFFIAYIEQVNSQISNLKIVAFINRKKKGLLHKISNQKQSKSHAQLVLNFLTQFSEMLSKKQNKYEVTQIKQEYYFTVCQGVTGINELKSLHLVNKFNSMPFLQQRIEQIQKKKQNLNNINQYEQNNKNESDCSIQSKDFQNNELQEIQDAQSINEQVSLENKKQRIGHLQQNQQNKRIYSQNKVVKQYKKQKQVFIKIHYLSEDWKRSPSGGLICINQQKISKQKQILKKVLTQLTQNILKQKSIMNISLPITIFKKQSQLMTVARNLSYAPLLFDIFYQQDNVDILQRMKYATIFQISNNIAGVNLQKPFNPILGQTIQLYINGCPIYLEQISHHPQISAFYFLGKGFTIYGNVQLKVTMSLNSCRAFNTRYKSVVFSDGAILQFGSNIMKISGTVFGDRIFNFQDKTFVYDKMNNILSLMTFGPKKKSLFQSSQQPLDYLYGKIMKMKYQFKQKYQKWKQRPISSPQEQIEAELSSFQGIWNKQIYFDQQKYFDFETILPHQIIEQQNPLPSNSSFRQDLKILIEGDLDQAQQQKNKMQQEQRKDQKLRKKYNKK